MVTNLVITILRLIFFANKKPHPQLIEKQYVNTYYYAFIFWHKTGFSAVCLFLSQFASLSEIELCKTCLLLLHLNNYFDFHVCLSFRRRVPCSVRRPCVRKLPPIPAAVWQNVTNKSCLVCVKGEKYTFLVTLKPLGSMR